MFSVGIERDQLHEMGKLVVEQEICQKQEKNTTFNPNTWCPLKGHTYLNKPAFERCMLF